MIKIKVPQEMLVWVFNCLFTHRNFEKGCAVLGEQTPTGLICITSSILKLPLKNCSFVMHPF